MTTTSPARAAPPPFSRQRARSRLVALALGLVLVATGVVGLVVTVPTYVSTTASVDAPSSCPALGLPAGPAGCVRARLDPGLADRLAPRTTGRVTAGDAPPVELVLAPTPSATGELTVGGALDAAPGPGPVTAVVDVGTRRLALVFLGHGLEARP